MASLKGKFELTGPFSIELMHAVEQKVLLRGHSQEELERTSLPVEYDLVFPSLNNHVIAALREFANLSDLESQRHYNQLILSAIEHLNNELVFLRSKLCPDCHEKVVK